VRAGEKVLFGDIFGMHDYPPKKALSFDVLAQVNCEHRAVLLRRISQVLCAQLAYVRRNVRAHDFEGHLVFFSLALFPDGKPRSNDTVVLGCAREAASPQLDIILELLCLGLDALELSLQA